MNDCGLLFSFCYLLHSISLFRSMCRTILNEILLLSTQLIFSLKHREFTLSMRAQRYPPHRFLNAIKLLSNIRNNNNFKCRHSTKNNWAWLYIFGPINCQYYMYFNSTNWKCIRVYPVSVVRRMTEYRIIFCIFFSLKLIFVSFWNSRNNYNNYTRNHNHYWVNDRYVIIYIVL